MKMNPINRTFFLRALAFLIDVAFCIAVAVITVKFLVLKGASLSAEVPVWVLLIPVAPAIMMILTTAMLGRTLGKWICRIRVCRSDLSPPGFVPALLRELTKAVTFFALGPLGPILAIVQSGMGYPV